MKKVWRLVCYDVRDQKRYRRLYKLIKGYGQPVQYSIFRCKLGPREVERMKWELESVLHTEDSLLIVDLPPSEVQKLVARHDLEPWEDEYFVIVPPLDQGSSDVTTSKGTVH